MPTSQPVTNVQNTINLATMTSDSQEKIWAKRIIEGSQQSYTSVFFDNMVGPMGSGRPFIVNDDAKVVDGNTVVIHTLSKLGGPGVQGSGFATDDQSTRTFRSGNEDRMRIGTFNFKVGRQWFGVAIDDVAANETVIGSQWDNYANRLLRERLGKKKSDDMMFRLRHEALDTRVDATTPSGRNVVRPNNKSSREALVSADVVSTSVISRAGLVGRANGAKPADLRKDKSGAKFSRFVFFTNQFATPQLRMESAYTQARNDAAERGASNPAFYGGFLDWEGHGIYEHTVEDHDTYGAVGDAFVPRAFLGTAIVGKATDDTPGVIYGGGSAAGAAVLPLPRYFEFFSNAEYEYCNGETRAADTSTDRYAWILVLTGADAGKMTFINYRTNSGGSLTIRKILGSTATGDYATTVGSVVWTGGAVAVTGKTVTGTFTLTEGAIPAGSLIVEANSYGVTFGFSAMLGEMAGLCGHGSLKGRSAMAARTQQDDNHGMDHAIGVETVWGCNTVARTDGERPNYVLVEHAIQYDGLPVIS